MSDTTVRTVDEAIAIARNDPFQWNVGRSGELAPGIEVWTTWLPVQGYYETLVVSACGYDKVKGFEYKARTHTRIDAVENHASVVKRLQAFLADREVV